MNQADLEAVVARIERMERCFDRLCEAVKSNQPPVFSDSDCKRMLRELIDYYEGGQWLRDYTLDEQGMLPQTLKRGVLSEDGVYNLLSALEDARQQ